MSEEQASTVIEIAERNTSMYDLSTNSQTLAEETAEVIYKLSKQMDEYRLTFLNSNLVFNDKDIINVGKTDHLLWKWNIYNMLLGLVDLSESDVVSHEACRLGNWYYGKLPPEIRNQRAFKDLEQPHIAVHDYAKQAIEYYKKGDIDTAKKFLSRLEEASQDVINLLEELDANL